MSQTRMTSGSPAAASPPQPKRSGPRHRWMRTVAILLLLCGLLAWGWAPGLATYHRHSASKLTEEFRLNEALTHARQAERLQPHHVDGLLQLVSLQRQTDHLAAAAATLALLEELGVDSIRLKEERTLLAVRSGNGATLEADLGRFLMDGRLDSRDVCDSFVTGYRALSRLPEAIMVLEAWESDWPADYRPPAHRGLVAQMQLDWTSAVSSFRSAIACGDPRPVTRIHLGRSLLELRELQAALEAFQAALDLSTNEADAWKGLADTLRLLGQLEKSAAALEKGLQLNPSDFDAELALALNAADQENPAVAVERLEDFLQVWPEDSTALYAYGQALLLTGQDDEAAEILKLWKQADEQVVRMEELLNQLQNDPGNDTIRCDAACLMMAHYSRSSAVQLLQAVLRSQPENDSAKKCLDDFQRKAQQRQTKRH